MKIEIPPLDCISERDCRAICLQGILNYFGMKKDLEEINKTTNSQYKARDWDYSLGCYAIKQGFQATIHTRSLTIFDPTWFDLEKQQLSRKVKLKANNLEALAKSHRGFQKFSDEAKRILDFLDLNGKLDFRPFSEDLIESYLSTKIPIIITVTGQLVYNTMKERNGKPEDVEGDPWKHSLIINGFDRDHYFVCDPSRITGKERYQLKKDFVLDGITRYDNNMIVIKPGSSVTSVGNQK